MPKGRILIVDDDPEQLELLSALLSSTACEIQTADSTSAATQALARARFHAAVCDLVMPSGGGAEILHFARQHGIQTPIIILTGYADAHIAEVCSGLGAFDFVAKPVDRLSLIAVLRRALLRSGLIFEEIPRSAPRVRPPALAYLVGASQPMGEVFAQIAKVAEASANVCIYGESGTGKELVAQAIHSLGPRRDRPLVVLDCASIPEGLMESELFGHVKGAFTGAVANKRGKFHAADGGTLFLDEIGELPVALQVKLLRALQEKSVVRVGDTRPEAVDIRVLAATNKELEMEIRRGTFREDLFYRLNVVNIHLPPLRDRGDDLMVIAKYLLNKFAEEFASKVRGLSPNAVIAIRKYNWPGNIRQLENHLKKGVVLADKALLGPEDLGLTPDELPPILPLAQAKEEYQRRYINEVLARNNGNRTKTARDLGVDPRTIFRHLEREDELRDENK